MSKYKKGDFGYWWTIIEGNSDIEGQIYDGDINCYNKNLTSLKGCPKQINGEFYCYDNNLTSLEFGPKQINGNFDCSRNELTSLEYCPKQINGVIYCYNNQIKDKNEFKNIKFCEYINTDFNIQTIMSLIKQNSPEYYI